MNVLKSVETTIANLVEGAFGRLFRSEVRPIELARKLAREMDEHKTVSVSRVYVPNEYVIWLSPEDREFLCGYYREDVARLSRLLDRDFDVTVGRDIDLAPFRTAPVPLASRAFNAHLLKVFADELKAPTGDLKRGAVVETETGSDAGPFRTGDNAGRFN